jgi:branched-chain amino acid transport system substrate-binding protein
MKRTAWRHRITAGVVGVITAMSLVACSHDESRDAAQSAQCGDPGHTEGNSTLTVSDGSVPTPNTGLGQFGLGEDCVYTGPGGFTLDPSKCPPDWNNSAGITADQIRLFTSVPHAGNLAAYGAIADGINAYFQYVNDNGGIYGRKIVYDIKDDQLQPDLTRQNTDAAIQSGDYAGGYAVLGSSGNLAIHDLTNKECMPQIASAAAADQLQDPQNFPWTTGFGLNYYNESAIWAKWITSKFPQGATVAILAPSNAQGEAYTNGFNAAIKGTNIKVVTTQTNEVSATNLDNQVTTAAATGADVAILPQAGTLCTAGMAGIERSSWKPTVIVGNACSGISTVFAPLQKQGLTGNGSHVVRYYYFPTDNDNPNTAFTQTYTKVVSQQGLDPNNAQIANGFWWGWYGTQILLDAGQLKGGLNRANINIAAHSFDSHYPLELEGVRGKVSGVDDAYPFESGRMYVYDNATPAQTGTFSPSGPLIDNEGALKNWSTIQSG